MGENLKVVWAEFPTLSAILQGREYLMHIIHLLKLKTRPRFCPDSFNLFMLFFISYLTEPIKVKIITFCWWFHSKHQWPLVTATKKFVSARLTFQTNELEHLSLPSSVNLANTAWKAESVIVSSRGFKLFSLTLKYIKTEVTNTLADSRWSMCDGEQKCFVKLNLAHIWRT